MTGSFEPNHEHDNDDDDEDDEDGRDSSSRDGASSYTDSYGAGDQNQRGDGRSDGEGMQRRRSERERYGDKKGAHGTAVTMRLYMLDPEDPARALPSGLQQLIDECCPRHEIPPP